MLFSLAVWKIENRYRIFQRLGMDGHLAGDKQGFGSVSISTSTTKNPFPSSPNSSITAQNMLDHAPATTVMTLRLSIVTTAFDSWPKNKGNLGRELGLRRDADALAWQSGGASSTEPPHPISNSQNGPPNPSGWDPGPHTYSKHGCPPPYPPAFSLCSPILQDIDPTRRHPHTRSHHRRIKCLDPTGQPRRDARQQPAPRHRKAVRQGAPTRTSMAPQPLSTRTGGRRRRGEQTAKKAPSRPQTTTRTGMCPMLSRGMAPTTPRTP
jgi:hypothetical protein